MADAPTVDAVRAARARLGNLVETTPVRRLSSPLVERRLGKTEVILKEELFQRTGSFKPRGALCVMLDLPGEALARGVTCVSAGNHAMATAYAARVLGTTAKVVMPRNASPFRVAGSRELGAEVELVDNVHQAFDRVHEIESKEGRTFVHPFEGPKTALGTATVGLELVEQAGALDAVIVPIGGGGLAAGMAARSSSCSPLLRSTASSPPGPTRCTAASPPARRSPSTPSGPSPTASARRTPPRTASSSAASSSMSWSYVDDDQLRDAMLLLFTSAKLAVEPAGAAATAALLGPLRERLDGKRVGIIVCGGNIDAATFAKHLADAVARAS